MSHPYMSHPDSAVVTGAFSYTGGYVARRLVDQGVSVRTLSRHPDSRNDFGGLVQAAPLDFWCRADRHDQAERLAPRQLGGPRSDVRLRSSDATSAVSGTIPEPHPPAPPQRGIL